MHQLKWAYKAQLHLRAWHGPSRQGKKWTPTGSRVSRWERAGSTHQVVDPTHKNKANGLYGLASNLIRVYRSRSLSTQWAGWVDPKQLYHPTHGKKITRYSGKNARARRNCSFLRYAYFCRYSALKRR